MTIQEAFDLINNLDVKESRRKFSPQWSIVSVDQSGTVLEIMRCKEQPNSLVSRKNLEQFPDTVQFTAWPGRFETLAELQETLHECVEVHRSH